MRGTTHFFAGAAAAALINPEPEFILTAAAAAMLPDIDHPNSKISQLATFGPMRSTLSIIIFAAGAYFQASHLMMFGTALFIISLLPHRTVTHSLLALLLIYIFFPTAAFIGYASHIALDMLSGTVPLLWPYNKRFGLHLTGKV